MEDKEFEVMPEELLHPDCDEPLRVIALPHDGSQWVCVRRLTYGAVLKYFALRNRAAGGGSAVEAAYFARRATYTLIHHGIGDYNLIDAERLPLRLDIDRLHPKLLDWLELKILSLNCLTGGGLVMMQRELEALKEGVLTSMRYDKPLSECVPQWATEVLSLYAHYLKGHLPRAGGILNNSYWLVKAFEVLMSAESQYLSEMTKEGGGGASPSYLRPKFRGAEDVALARERAKTEAQKLIERIREMPFWQN